ncbi:VWA domain-containing protein [Limibacter armeniacum]|uniref:VWA domain-containing protein n=1 Tax=Limibacter armeniacum TaxID=466084 RepID=UPI002FE5AE2D
MKRLLSSALFLALIFLMISCSDDEGKGFLPRYEMSLIDQDVLPEKREVKILFQVLDENGGGKPDLTVSDFTIIENGNPIDTEGRPTIAPDSIPFEMKTVLLLDMSSSVETFVDKIKEASSALIDAKLDNQEIAIYTFDKQLTLLQDFTNDKELLKEKVNILNGQELTNSTNLYGAIINLTDNSRFIWDEKQDITEILKRNLIVFTDGRHNADPGIEINDVLQEIADKEVYVAALNSQDLDVNNLKKIAGTSNRYLSADNVGKLREQFVGIQQQIIDYSKSIYYLYYQSPITVPDSRENSLELKLKVNGNQSETGYIETAFNSEGFE